MIMRTISVRVMARSIVVDQGNIQTKDRQTKQTNNNIQRSIHRDGKRLS